jgi:hypothetical protein
MSFSQEPSRERGLVGNGDWEQKLYISNHTAKLALLAVHTEACLKASCTWVSVGGSAEINETVRC